METVVISPPLKPVCGDVDLPGSKSFSNRALILAAQAESSVEIHNVAEADDTDILLSGLRKIGCPVDRRGQRVTLSRPSLPLPQGVTIDIGHAGTAMRFLTAYLASLPVVEVVLCGSNRMHERPIGPLVDSLRQLGASIDYLERDGCPPIRISGIQEQQASRVQITADVSSQFVSALLLVAPTLPKGLTLSLAGDVVSAPYIKMTEHLLRHFGVQCPLDQAGRYSIPHQPLKCSSYSVEPDASGASYLWSIAALCGGEIGIKGLAPTSTQGDVHFVELLSWMGCTKSYSQFDGGIFRVRGPEQLLAGDFDLTEMPDVAQTLAVVAAFAKGESQLNGLQTLRHKETDRIRALALELRSVGIEATEQKAALRVRGGVVHPSRPIRTYDDHRMAMSFALLGTQVENIVIEDPKVVSKSFPTYWDTLDTLGFRVEN